MNIRQTMYNSTRMLAIRFVQELSLQILAVDLLNKSRTQEYFDVRESQSEFKVLPKFPGSKTMLISSAIQFVACVIFQRDQFRQDI